MLVAGPVMNILLAIVVLAFVLYQGADVPAYEQQAPVVGTVTADSPAAKSGIRRGDRLVSIAGHDVDTWEQAYMAIGAQGRTADSDRGPRAPDGLHTLDVTPEAQTKFEVGDIGVLPELHPQIHGVSPGGPADKAGMKPGDIVLAVNGKQDITLQELIDTIKANEGKPVSFELRRGSQVLTVSAIPALNGSVPQIGVEPLPFEVRRIEPGPIQAVQLSLAKNWEWTKLIVQTLVGLFTRETSVKQLMGPVAIAELSGESAQLGLLALFNLMAMISLNLGLLNLMPIPVLDGGHIAIMALEGLARRDFSVRVKERLLLAGFVLLLTLMVTVIYNDLTRVQWVEHLMFWR